LAGRNAAKSLFGNTHYLIAGILSVAGWHIWWWSCDRINILPRKHSPSQNSNDNAYIWHTTGSGKTLTSSMQTRLWWNCQTCTKSFCSR
jgi:hypothetical protein